MRGTVGGAGREDVDFTALRPACSVSQEDTLAYAVITGSLQILLSQWPRTEAAFCADL